MTERSIRLLYHESYSLDGKSARAILARVEELLLTIVTGTTIQVDGGSRRSLL